MSKQTKSQWDFDGLFPAEQTRRVLSVSELTTQIKRLLEKQVGAIWVGGELTNLRAQVSGHIYFTLKDAGAQLGCVLFSRENVAHRDVELAGEIFAREGRGSGVDYERDSGGDQYRCAGEGGGDGDGS